MFLETMSTLFHVEGVMLHITYLDIIEDQVHSFMISLQWHWHLSIGHCTLPHSTQVVYGNSFRNMTKLQYITLAIKLPRSWALWQQRRKLSLTSRKKIWLTLVALEIWELFVLLYQSLTITTFLTPLKECYFGPHHCF